MLGLSSILAEVRRSEGAIRLQHEEPPEPPPWTDAGRHGENQEPPPSRLYRVRINPPTSRQETNSEQQSPTSVPTPVNFVGYRPLSTDIKATPEIRLLKLLPGKDQEPLCCELIHAPLTNPPAYEALSYCWGGATPRAELSCDGSLISVTSNLAAALRILRCENSFRMLWVDSVCINQRDIDEKQHQVPLMGRIYRESTAVQVWLGNDTPRRTVATAFCILGNLKRLCERFGWDINFSHLVRYQTFAQYGLPDVVDDSWGSIRHLVEMPWFSRTWVIQEIMLSRQAYLHCDKSSLPWIDFCIGFLSLSQTFFAFRPDIMPSVSSYAQAMQLIISYHKAGHISTSHNLDLLALFENHRVARASDARDKVYAFLGIYGLTARRINGLIPDYHRTVQDTYVEAAREIVEQSPTLDILGVPHRDRQSGKNSLPSWVPDWSVSLQLNGFCFDEVTRVGYLSGPYLKQEGESGHVRISPIASAILLIAVHLDWLILSGGLSGRQYPNGQSTFDAFIRTIYLNDFSNNFSADQAAEWYRLLYVPFHALDKPWFGSSRISNRSRFALLTYSVLGRLFGPSVIKATTKVVRSVEAKIRLYSYVSFSHQPVMLRQISNDIVADAWSRSVHRRMFYTKSGYIGLGPRFTEAGDRVFLVRGGRTPLLFRPREVNWELLGDCYVHGIMQGEGFNEGKCKRFVVI